MNTRVTVLTMLIAVAVMAAPLGTEFTYQGILSDGGTPASGVFDFRCFLYNADAGGSQVGPVVLIEDLTVTDGRFTTQFDFGAVFDGTALWLEVGVRDGGSGGGYTVLQPRQELTAAPFAQHAKAADSAATAVYAATAGDADTLDGQHGAYYLTWANFVGIPNDIANGDDDTLADLSCSPDEIARWTGSAWNCNTDDDTPYSRTFVLGPVGNSTQNGTALRNAIAAITPPTSQEEAVLLKLEPGVYDLGSTALELHGWMIVEGSGENHTSITGAVCGGDLNTGTLHTSAERVMLSSLAVENTCDQVSYAVAFSSEGNSTSASDAVFRVESSASVNIAVHNTGTGLRLHNVVLSAANATGENLGLMNTGDDPDLASITAIADGGGVSAEAINNTGARLSLRHSELHALGSSGECTALVHSGGWFTLNDVEMDATSCPGISDGMHATNASGKIRNVKASAYSRTFELGTSGGNQWIDMYNVEADSLDRVVTCSSGTDTIYLDIRDSVLEGSNSAVVNLAVSCSVRIWLSHLEPGVSGVNSCLAVTSGNNFFADTCP